MTAYAGRHAELYDIFYGDKPYAQEAEFVHYCLQRYSIGETHRILELACGTGTHALFLEKLGYEIIAIDNSEDMLTRARHKAEEVSSKVEFRYQDMRSLNINEKPFDAVLCLFDSIGYVQTNEGLEQVLKGVYHNLRENGLFVFEFWHAPAMLCSYEPLRVRRWQTPKSQLVRIAETELDSARQLAKIKYTVYELYTDGTYTCFQETQTNRYFLVQEIALWLTTSGFTPVKWFAGFTPEENISEQTWHVVSVARKSKKHRA